MTDENIQQAAARWQREHDERRRQFREAMDEQVRGTPIVRIEARYDGCGDQGQIEELTCRDQSGREIDPPESAREAIEEYICAALPDGWEISQGSYGEVTIDLATGRAEFDHYDRIEKHEPFSDVGG